MNARAALRFLGRLVLLLAAAQLLPLACSATYLLLNKTGKLSEPLSAGAVDLEWRTVIAFAVSAGIAAVAGALMTWLPRPSEEVYRREGILIVVGGWVLASIFGAIPYVLAGTFDLPMDALFESASGFTTTGASALQSDALFASEDKDKGKGKAEPAPKTQTPPESENNRTKAAAVENSGKAGRGILFWRSFTQWLGGMGIIVLFVALLPELGPGARFLYKLEVPGPTAGALSPRIRETATILWKLYLLFTFAEIVLLMMAGLDLYDAATHTFSTLSTGGFSPRAESVAAFHSVWVEVIVIFFMLLAGANFSLYYGMKRLRKFNPWRDAEFRLYIQVMLLGVALVTWSLYKSGDYPRFLRALLDAAFHVVSILTTTGFVTADYEKWLPFSKMVLVALMFVGGCAGSTAGSMKVMRMAVGLKSAFREVRLIFSPNRVQSVFVSGAAVPEPVVRSVGGFFILYLSAWALGSVLLSMGSLDLVTAGTAAAATIGNIGPGLGEVGPTDNYAFFEWWEKGLMILLMWLGRLEVYAIAALFTRSFWRR